MPCSLRTHRHRHPQHSTRDKYFETLAANSTDASDLLGRGLLGLVFILYPIPYLSKMHRKSSHEVGSAPSGSRAEFIDSLRYTVGSVRETSSDHARAATFGARASAQLLLSESHGVKRARTSAKYRARWIRPRVMPPGTTRK